MRPGRLETASRERRQACWAEALPTIFESVERGWSISNATSAVVAAVEPFSGPRRSMQMTRWPSAVSASAIMAPLMPIPTTSTSVLTSRIRPSVGTAGAR